jgi:hypothetical protein
MKNLLIVARYNEDVSWTDDLDCTIIIYNKGEKLDPKYNAIDIPNFGREAETYLRAIKEHYDLMCTFDHVTFLQGDPFDHFPEVLNIIPQDNKNLVYDFPCPISTHNTVWFSTGNRAFAFRAGFSDCVATATYDDEYLKIIKDTTMRMQLPWYDNWIEYAGAQFIIPRKYIHIKSHDWWNHVYDIYECSDRHLYKNVNYAGMACVFEKLWHSIFTLF